MESDEALAEYQGRSPLVENVNGLLKAKYGLTELVVWSC